jgi:ribosomal protein S18 acetylase RimI-like enzyme
VKAGNVSIERADSSHVDGIMKLAQANYTENGGELTGTLDRNAVAATIQQLPSIVASRGQRVVGFLLTWEKGKSGNGCVQAMLEAYPGSSDAYVYGPVCVDASVRGLGIAGKMFEELKRLLPGREGILFIKASNESSLRAHRKMGMRETASYIFEGRRFVVLAYSG